MVGLMGDLGVAGLYCGLDCGLYCGLYWGITAWDLYFFGALTEFD